ncbi:DUF6271 family protein [Psychromonas sp. Urea-02u-13]|uniref:DUF6271 family protein n=1 Tax=Psychromonas sp. Urea-02u-13 TaxID=2058326 RepID=UPI0018E2CEE7|nr:DUF6271 family protein [Psychromonas sp. Urea-02u-13]
MKNICLCIPTNRECVNTIALLAEEAQYATKHFDVFVYLLILDTSEGQALVANQVAVANLIASENIQAKHLNNVEQGNFLENVMIQAGMHNIDKFMDLMLPSQVSYGACTNRAFLISTALGCDSIHRRDSDSHYQVNNGNKIFPIHNELMSLGKRASQVLDCVDHSNITVEQEAMPVSIVGSSFIGEMSVDIQEINDINPAAYQKIVGLWAPHDATAQQTKELVDESFKGGGNTEFSGDVTYLGCADPMQIDMCNVSFYKVHQTVPLPPAKCVIGSDYFLLHLIHDTKLPGVVHNRHIENFYTPERRTDTGFMDYQFRLVKFFLSMPYFYAIYSAMEEQGQSLLDNDYQVNSAQLVTLIEQSTTINQQQNRDKIQVLIEEYKNLGGRYTKFSDLLIVESDQLVEQAKQDMHDFALLSQHWPILSKTAQLMDINSNLVITSKEK